APVLWSVDRVHVYSLHVADIGPVAGDHAPGKFKENHRVRLLSLHVEHGICRDADQREPGISRTSVPDLVQLAKPCLPIGLVERTDSLPIGRYPGGSAHGYPLPGFGVEEGEVNVRIVLELVEFMRLDIGDVPEIGHRLPFLAGHWP